MAKKRGLHGVLAFTAIGAIATALFVFVAPIERLTDAWLHAPWAHGRDARGNLTGAWTAALPDGRVLDLDLARETGPDGLPAPAEDRDATLVSRATLCRGRERASALAVAGAANRRASRVRLRLDRPPETAGELRGAWSGATLELAGRLDGVALELVLRRGAGCG